MSLFNEGDPKYKCCCHRTHVRSGAMVIGILHAGSLLISFIRSTMGSMKTGTVRTYRLNERGELISSDKTLEYVLTALSAVMFFVSLASVICLFYGIFKIKPKFLIPEIVLQVVTIVLFGILIILTIVVLAAYSTLLENFIEQNQGETSEKADAETVSLAAKIAGGMVIGILLVAMAIEYWLFTVLKKCYVFLKDKEQFLNSNAGARYVVGGVQPGSAMERQPMVVVQAPSSSYGQQEPPPGYSQKY